ncbi:MULTISPECIES: MFS transporter [Pseudonocardia]|uniref:Antiseptic resistance protein n=2 Tax=Pseudonocardia TaxID=1847 RepID=A0A1Y2MM39_PSEAH|nr:MULTISPECIES: MFS transporter [Pseudonocardia]OSY35528.1 Antiseptic resistance protein [Pseudonocardia autotrophica]TDN76347.1 DHA2 family multidrug resistance protein-like MFS transporter [Pseudonocardia autotrophica]BBG00331.1 MFS transporter [Pseudonocardia autotrophica]GEC27478.1 MFS transporter [Pseudonocardia saturnea]
MTSVAADALSPPRRWAALAVLSLAVLVLAVDNTVLYLAVPSLTADLAPTANEILWIGDVYSLALAGLLIVAGSLADRVGRKRLLLLGAAAFGAASLFAALSTSPTMLIAARLLLGVAAATLMPSTLSLIRTIFTDPAERTRAIAVWAAAASGGAAVGPLVGGALLEHFSWGAVFLINVPIMVLLIVFGAWLLPESRDPAPGPFDPVSALLSMTAIVPVVWAIKHTVSAGVDVLGLAALLAGAVMGVVFVRRQRRLTVPLIDVSLFARPAFSGAVFAGFMAVFALIGTLFFFSQYLQLVRGFSPLQAGLGELPTTLSAVAVVAVVGWLSRRLGLGRAIATSLLLVSAGLAAVAVAEGFSSYLWLALALIPLGLGVGLAQTLTTDAVVSSVPPRRAGAASAISETALELGVAMGVAVLGSVVSLVYRGWLDLPADLSAEHRAAVTDSLAAGTHPLDPGSPVLDGARAAFTVAMQTTSLIAAAVTLAAAVVAWRTIPSSSAAPVGDVGRTGAATRSD